MADGPRHTRALERSRKRQQIIMIVAAAVLGVAVIVGAVAAWIALRHDPAADRSPRAAQSVPSTQTAASANTSATAQVPDLSGLALDEAKLVVQSAGLTLTQREEGASVATASKVIVRDQSPEPGTIVPAASEVVAIVPPVVAAVPKKSAAKQPKAPSTGFVVVIDPGHQARANITPEPVGPGSSVTKPKVTGGATGVSTGANEYDVVLQIAQLLAADLRAKGVKVVMTRTSNDVDLSNIERAKIANDAKADLFIRIHADSVADPSITGISTLVPAKSAWTSKIYASSKRAGEFVQAQVLKSTGAADRGVVERADLTGFNWSKVPAILVETGMMSNAVEDKLLSSPAYQSKLAKGMTAGIVEYLRGTR